MAEDPLAWQIGPEVVVQIPPHSPVRPFMDTVFSLARVPFVQKPRYSVLLDAEELRNGALQILADEMPVFQIEHSDEGPPVIEKMFAHYCARMCVGYAVFHAAALRINGKGLLLPAERGSGKSTLCSFLTRRGFEYLGDDLIFVNLATLDLHAFPKAITLKSGSFDFVPEEDTYQDAVRGEVRYFTPANGGNGSIAFDKLKLIVLPNFTPEGVNQARQVPPEIVALSLVQQTFGGLERDERTLDAIARFAEKPAFMIEYSHQDFAETSIRKLMGEPAT
ncbi:MAG: hypothetical protein ACI9TH_002518 [Kiritimatiellia bacterium]|jgi:hypothetical protein